ncbi:oligosaccharide flippase family protein [Paenibacillus pasadenensis]|uniref:lipopolysaccharide biosynthesis protein n=1 Tax=Paenibacillus pasadenensis TaxID=217090 RepID=UPI00203DCEC9|nr:oligosaccharide flippase family protein [Paenibacillus pasadenensis]MCM3748271.1 oligosaccharide flippase family protein [Paenibacillus pasadenensis]
MSTEAVRPPAGGAGRQPVHKSGAGPASPQDGSAAEAAGTRQDDGAGAANRPSGAASTGMELGSSAATARVDAAAGAAERPSGAASTGIAPGGSAAAAAQLPAGRSAAGKAGRLSAKLGGVLRGKGSLATIARTSGANVLIMLLGTLSSILTARMLGAEGKGELAAILFWPAFLAGMTGFGLPTSLIYQVKRGAQLRETAALALSLLLPVSLITAAVAWMFLPQWMDGYSAEAVRSARLYTVLAVPMALAVNLIAAAAQVKGRFGVYNGIRLYVPLLNLAGLVGLWAAGSLTIPAAAIVYLVTTAIVIALALFGMRDELGLAPLKRIWSRRVARPLLGYGSRVYGTDLLGTLYGQFDKLIILALLTPRDFGIYSVIFALSRMFNVVQNAITSVVFPKVTGASKEVVVASVSRAFRLSMLLMLIAVVPAMIIGNMLIGLVFGPDFAEAGAAFYLLSIECILGGGSWILASAFNAMGRPGMVFVRQIIALTATVGLFFVFTPMMGLEGLALALLCGAVIRMAVSVASMKLLFGVPLRSIVSGREDLKFLKQRIQSRRRAAAAAGEGAERA